jgi:hypothetical protein
VLQDNLYRRLDTKEPPPGHEGKEVGCAAGAPAAGHASPLLVRPGQLTRLLMPSPPLAVPATRAHATKTSDSGAAAQQNDGTAATAALLMAAARQQPLRPLSDALAQSDAPQSQEMLELLGYHLLEVLACNDSLRSHHLSPPSQQAPPAQQQQQPQQQMPAAAMKGDPDALSACKPPDAAVQAEQAAPQTQRKGGEQPAPQSVWRTGRPSRQAAGGKQQACPGNAPAPVKPPTKRKQPEDKPQKLAKKQRTAPSGKAGVRVKGKAPPAGSSAGEASRGGGRQGRSSPGTAARSAPPLQAGCELALPGLPCAPYAELLAIKPAAK